MLYRYFSLIQTYKKLHNIDSESLKIQRNKINKNIVRN